MKYHIFKRTRGQFEPDEIKKVSTHNTFKEAEDRLEQIWRTLWVKAWAIVDDKKEILKKIIIK